MCKIDKWACNCATEPWKAWFWVVCHMGHLHPHVQRLAAGRKRNPPPSYARHRAAVELWGEGYSTLMTMAFGSLNNICVPFFSWGTGIRCANLGRLCGPSKKPPKSSPSLYSWLHQFHYRGFLHLQQMWQHLPHINQLQSTTFYSCLLHCHLFFIKFPIKPMGQTLDCCWSTETTGSSKLSGCSSCTGLEQVNTSPVTSP